MIGVEVLVSLVACLFGSTTWLGFWLRLLAQGLTALSLTPLL